MSSERLFPCCFLLSFPSCLLFLLWSSSSSELLCVHRNSPSIFWHVVSWIFSGVTENEHPLSSRFLTYHSTQFSAQLLILAKTVFSKNFIKVRVLIGTFSLISLRFHPTNLILHFKVLILSELIWATNFETYITCSWQGYIHLWTMLKSIRASGNDNITFQTLITVDIDINKLEAKKKVKSASVVQS